MSKNARIYFIQEYLLDRVRNGSIGNVDIEKILIENGARSLLFPSQFDFSFWAKIRRALYLLKTIIFLPPGAIVFFQYPYHARMTGLLLKLLRYRRHIHVVCIIADINGIKHGNPQLLKKEKKMFGRFRYFIVHHAAMENWLSQFVPESISVRLNFFDFLASVPAVQRKKDAVVVFAGNLEKSGFLARLDRICGNDPGLIFNVYGEPVTDALLNTRCILYKGVFDPYELPQKINGSFGLVWDGEEADRPDAVIGHYMEYITHHKVSLYIICGLPLIIYEKAGAAALVKQYGIGITISNLSEIGEKIRSITPEDYAAMSNNCRQLAYKISSGGNLSAAYHEILNRIREDRK